MNKELKLGDKVKIINDDHFPYEHRGDIGTVIKIYDDQCKIATEISSVPNAIIRVYKTNLMKLSELEFKTEKILWDLSWR